MGGKHFSDGRCRPIRMKKVCRSLGLRQNRVEQFSILRNDVDMRPAKVVSGKHGMAALMLSLKEAEIK